MHKETTFFREHPVALIALIITVVCLAAGLSTGVSGFLGGKEGISGYISTWAWRLGVSFAALSAAAYIVVRGMNANKQKGRSIVRTALMALGVAVCLLLVIWLLQAPIRDIPYLMAPEGAYVRQLSYDVSTGEDTDHYYVEGISAEGKEVRFQVNRSTYRQGKELLEKNPGVIMKIDYLPHTDVVMELDYKENLDRAAYQDRISPELSDNPESFQIQIGQDVFTVPVAVSRLREKGWNFVSQEEANTMVASIFAPWESRFEDHPLIHLVNDSGQTITVFVRNTADHEVPAQDCMADVISLSNDNLEYEGIDVFLPGELILSWSGKEQMTEQYGRPDEINELGDYETEYTYHLLGEEYGHRLRLGYGANDLLNSIWIENWIEADD